MVTGNTTIDATENVCLFGVDCDLDGTNDNAFTGTLAINAGGDLTLGIGGTLTVTSSLTAGGDLQFIADTIIIDTDISTDQLSLTANTGGVQLNDTFAIEVTDLFLTGAGNFDLENQRVESNSEFGDRHRWRLGSQQYRRPEPSAI